MRILPRADLPCASAHVYSCQRLAKASTSTSLSSRSVVVELISRECAESRLFRLFAVYWLLAICGSNAIMTLRQFLTQILIIIMVYGMTLSEVKCMGGIENGFGYQTYT